jgi:hypothetical protein
MKFVMRQKPYGNVFSDKVFEACFIRRILVA